MHPSRLVSLIGFIASLSLFFPRPAHAYIDLGTGSYFLQILIASILGALFSIKVYWSKIKDLLRGWLSGRNKDKQAPDE